MADAARVVATRKGIVDRYRASDRVGEVRPVTALGPAQPCRSAANKMSGTSRIAVFFMRLTAPTMWLSRDPFQVARAAMTDKHMIAVPLVKDRALNS